MTVNIQFKRGLKNNLPTSAPEGTPLWCTDTKELYIGTGEGVSLITGSGYSKQEIDELIGNVEAQLREV